MFKRKRGDKWRRENKEKSITENEQDHQEESEIKGVIGSQKMEQKEASPKKEEQLKKNIRNMDEPKSNPPEKQPSRQPWQTEEDDELKLDNEEEEKQNKEKSHKDRAPVELVDLIQKEKPRKIQAKTNKDEKCRWRGEGRSKRNHRSSRKGNHRNGNGG